jgi:Icc-related predicted phosphoesterase
MNIFFATDIHGSGACWRKFLRCAEFYGADTLILGGDMTGKGLAPILGRGGSYYTYIHDQRHDVAADELDHYVERIRDQGLYPIVVDEEDFEELRQDEKRLDELFQREVLEGVQRWVALAEERLAGSSVRCFVCPGNDDMLEVDEILAGSERLEVAEGRVVDLAEGYALVSTGWSNPTPWNTYREDSEEQLAARIDSMVRDVTVAPERLIFNLHCPPHDTPLDEAPAITEDMELVEAGRVSAHVGSTAVRDAIEQVQPALALHGHIHESRGVTRIGRTLAINPGSSYEQGVLLGALVQVNGKKKVKHYQLTTG